MGSLNTHAAMLRDECLMVDISQRFKRVPIPRYMSAANSLWPESELGKPKSLVFIGTPLREYHHRLELLENGGLNRTNGGGLTTLSAQASFQGGLTTRTIVRQKL